MPQLYKIKKKGSKETGLRDMYLVSFSKWNRIGKYLTLEDALDVLTRMFQENDGKVPDSILVQTYEVTSIKDTEGQMFLMNKSNVPVIKGI